MAQIISKINLFLLLGLTISIFGCKEDKLIKDTKAGNGGEAEKQWLEDYVSPDLLWGFIDTSGRVLIPPAYDDVRDFKNGFAVANLKGKWGYIDTMGKVIIGFKYLNAFDFNSGKALVQNFDKRFYYINSTGEKEFDCPGNECSSFVNNFAIFKRNEFYGLLDQRGKISTSAQFTHLKPLSDDRFIAALGDNYGVIDSKGNWLLQPQFQRIYPVSDGLIKVKKSNQYFFLDEKGLVQLIGPFDGAGEFCGGHTFVKRKNEYFILGKDGKVSYRGKGIISNGGEGKWIEKIGKNSRFIDFSGASVSSIKFDQAFIFHEGIAGFSQDENWGYLNSDGIVVVPPFLPIIWDCRGARIRFISETGYGYLDKAGKVVIAPKYPEARDFVGGYARISDWTR
ncbi:MAG: WG repeat-containing protein [Saprospiraceae bacterium]|nr:WG repeat-containing protein [Saprospiraceae bacterium]